MRGQTTYTNIKWVGGFMTTIITAYNLKGLAGLSCCCLWWGSREKDMRACMTWSNKNVFSRLRDFQGCSRTCIHEHSHPLNILEKWTNSKCAKLVNWLRSDNIFFKNTTPSSMSVSATCCLSTLPQCVCTHTHTYTKSGSLQQSLWILHLDTKV